MMDNLQDHASELRGIISKATGLPLTSFICAARDQRLMVSVPNWHLKKVVEHPVVERQPLPQVTKFLSEDRYILAKLVVEAISG